LRKKIAESDAPLITKTMDLIFVEYQAFQGSTNDGLRARFQAWAREDPAETHSGRDYSRHQFFFKVNGDLLQKGNVGIAQGRLPEPLFEDWLRNR
jgi:hypothetical protein